MVSKTIKPQAIKMLGELKTGSIYHVTVKKEINSYVTKRTIHHLSEWLTKNVPECKFIVTSDNINIGVKAK